jgi:hypothetical protein
MITLKQISEKVASILNQPNNFELKERIKDSMKHIYATRIRQSFATNGIDEFMKLNYTIELEKYNKLQTELEGLTYNSPIEIRDDICKLRSLNKVLPSIRFRNDAPYTKVSADTLIINYVNSVEQQYNTGDFSKGTSYYLDNNYMIVVTNLESLPKLRYINIETVFEDPEKVLNYYNQTIMDEDMELPIPYDMIESIIGEMLKTEFGLVPVIDNQVKVNPQ